MPEARPVARRLPGLLTAVLCLAAAAAEAQNVAGLRSRAEALAQATRWDGAAEVELVRDLDAAVSQLRNRGGSAATSAALRDLVNRTHTRHREGLQRLEQGGDELEESEEWIERKPLALQTLYLRNWLYLDAATRFEPQNPARRDWLRDAVAGFGDLTTTGDPLIAAESFYGRALAERALGQKAEATADLRRALDKKPPAELAARIGVALVEAQIDDEQLGPALESSAALLRQAPGPEAEFLRAKVALLALTSLPLDADRRRALRDEVAALVVALEKRGGRWPAMARQLVAAGITKPEDWLDEGDSATIRWAVAESLRGSGRCKDALPLYQALAAQRGAGGETLVALAECQYRAGAYAEALATLERLPAKGGGGDAAYLRFKAAEALDQQAGSAASTARLRDAAGALLADHADHPQAFEAHFRLGELALRDGDRLAAAGHFDAVRGDPQFALQATFQSAQAYVAEWEERAAVPGAEPDAALAVAALERLRRFLAQAETFQAERGGRAGDQAALAPLQARARVLGALLLTRQGDAGGAEEAIVWLEDFRGRHPTATDLHGQASALRAIALLELDRPGDADAAIIEFLAAPQPGPRDYVLMQRLGVRTLELAAERADAGDPAGALALRRAALALYRALLAATDAGAVRNESPDGLRRLVDRLQRETATPAAATPRP